MITDELLIKNGYHKFDGPYSLQSESVVAGYQKRFDDNNGKKYFITFWKYDNQYIRNYYIRQGIEPPNIDDYSYEAETQLYLCENRNPMNIDFFNGWTIDKIEQSVEIIWKSLGCSHYETWEGDRC